LVLASNIVVDHFMNTYVTPNQHFLPVPEGLSNKRANYNCPVKQYCNDIGGTCYTTAPCTACVNQLNTCLFTAGINSTYTCICNQNYINCLNAYPACYAYTPYAVTNCQVNTNCICPAAVAPTSVSYCLSDSYCNAGFCTGLQSSGPCTPNQGVCGDSVNVEFGIAYSCQNISGSFQCAKTPHVMSAGDSCATSNDCVDSIPCIGGLCVGTAVGGTCTSSYSCAFGLWCNNGMCAAQTALGGTCNASNSLQCYGTGVCGFNSVCVAANSVPVGGNCIVNQECTYNSFCATSKTCVAIPATPMACLNSTDCANSVYGGACGCDPYNANPVCFFSLPSINLAPCATLINTGNTCVLNGQCKPVLGGLTGTCTYNKCSNQVNCAELCVVNNNQPFFGTAACLKFPPFICKAGASVLSFGTYLILALIVFLIL